MGFLKHAWKEVSQDWKDALSGFDLSELELFLENEHKSGERIYPPQSEIFRAFRITPLEKVRVVILGQDPYHGEGQAHGLAFSVREEVALPPSLRNIFQEILGSKTRVKDGDLSRWAAQGVFLLNTVLTVRAGQAFSHRKKGWEAFTDRVIDVLTARSDRLIFLLWGKPAQTKAERIEKQGAHHLVLKAPHPSPLSAHSGFFGCEHFSKVNRDLSARGVNPIQWI